MTSAAAPEGLPWQADQVLMRDGTAIPVRATARRPRWDQLPDGVRREIETAAGASVVGSVSAGTGFTPGFASRLDLADGSRVFVKAASSADDALHGWPMSDAYREEARKLALLSFDVGAPPLLWTLHLDVGGDRWIVLGFACVEGCPPRRPWRPDQLKLVLAKFAETAPALAQVPAGLDLEPLADHLLARVDWRLQRIRDRDGDSDWLRTVERLSADGHTLLGGDSVVHMDLRDDNVLIGTDGRVWFVDWNWPVVGAAWVDVICVLLSARGDGVDIEPLIAGHPLTRDVAPRAIDCLLATLWSFWATTKHDAVPHASPHLRNHQSWYADVTREWLEERLSRSPAFPRTGPSRPPAFRFVRVSATRNHSAGSDESDG